MHDSITILEQIHHHLQWPLYTIVFISMHNDHITDFQSSLPAISVMGPAFSDCILAGFQVLRWLAKIHVLLSPWFLFGQGIRSLEHERGRGEEGWLDIIFNVSLASRVFPLGHQNFTFFPPRDFYFYQARSCTLSLGVHENRIQNPWDSKGKICLITVVKKVKKEQKIPRQHSFERSVLRPYRLIFNKVITYAHIGYA